MEITLNVSVIEPRLKHPTIFKQFDELQAGENFIILNDHDPKPLYYQMIAERGETFNWEYLAEGPLEWQVRITKLASGEKSSTIGELVAADYRKAEVFRKFGLDFCCGGNKTIEEACKKKGVNPQDVEKALSAVDEQVSNPSQDFKSWSLDFLADYIVATHHKYVVNSIPVLAELSNKVARVHGDSHPELVEMNTLCSSVINELTSHMQKEEQILFPYIKELWQAKQQGTKVNRPPFGSIQNPINIMEAEHVEVGDEMELIRNLSSNYTLPIDACTSYRVLFSKLQEFERDLHQHIHLENNILFVKAIELEKEVML